MLYPHNYLGIEDLCSKRDELHKQILQEEEEKQKIQNDLRILTERLSQVNESLARKIATRNDYDKTISETENAYKKVIDVQCSLLMRTPSGPAVLSFVERLSSFRGDFLYRVCIQVLFKITFGLSFVARFVLFWSFLHWRFHCIINVACVLDL